MLHEQVRTHILGLNDSELLEYVLTGQRMYEPEAVAFARQELERRAIPPAQMQAMRLPIVSRLVDCDLSVGADPLRATSVNSIVCQRCGLEAPTRYVEYQENIGAIFVRFTKSHRGHFCRKCNHKLFRSSTFTTCVAGWWGVISFFVTIGCLVNNLVAFVQSFSIPPLPPDARPPQCDQSVIDKIAPHVDLIMARLADGVDLSDIAREIAPAASVSPGEAFCAVWLLCQQIAARREEACQSPTFGFPVVVPGKHPS